MSCLLSFVDIRFLHITVQAPLPKHLLKPFLTFSQCHQPTFAVSAGLPLENMATKKVNKRTRAEAETEVNPRPSRHTDPRLTRNKL